jgi:hypothetical protein
MTICEEKDKKYFLIVKLFLNKDLLHLIFNLL